MVPGQKASTDVWTIKLSQSPTTVMYFLPLAVH